ncbi:TolC family outer membrane protein [Chitinimonas taiwanensis]|uniref:TolC family outer membrane protein n=1 Tax=Chitinimonas taiwanensis TaxID=240412 RepID=UPI00161C2F26
MKAMFGWLPLTVMALSLQQAYAAPQTLKEAVEQAILQNPEVRYRYHNLQASTEEQDAAKGAYLPRVDLSAEANRTRTDTPSAASRSYQNPSATIQLRQTLFDGFATRNEARRLGHVKQARYYELLAASDEVGLEAARAYVDVLRYRRMVELARQNYAVHQEIHALLSQKVAAGVGRRVDLEQAAGRLALAESNWLTEESNLHDVSTRYQRVIGERPAAQLGELPKLDAALPAGDTLLQDSIRRNPTFLAAVSGIRAGRADADVRRAGYWPTLEFKASQSLERNRDGAKGEYRDGVVGLVLNYNLFRGGSDRARVRQYSQQLNAAYDLRDKACRDVRQTALIAVNDVRRIREQIKLLSQHELSTAKARDAYRQQFDIGQRSLLDLLDTENELFEARRSLASAEFDQELAKLRTLASGHRLLSALELQAMQSGVEEEDGGVAEDDGLLTCNTDLPPTPVLDKPALPALPPVVVPPKPQAPAAAPAPVVIPPAAKKLETLTVSAAACFDFGKSELKKDGRKIFDEIAAKLIARNYDPAKTLIVVEGHSDRIGKPAKVQQISEARAENIRERLIERGLPANMISAKGMGMSEPVTKPQDCKPVAKNRNKLVECYAPDRRVEVEIYATVEN